MNLENVKKFCERIQNSDNRWTKYPIFIVKHEVAIPSDPAFDDDAFYSDEYEAFIKLEDVPYNYNFFFSYEDANDFLNANKHNLNNPKIYVEHLYRNPSVLEMVQNYFEMAEMKLPEFWK